MILVSIAAHERPWVILELYSNLCATYNNNVALVVHISADTRDLFFLKQAADEGLNLNRERLFWNDQSLRTRWGTTMPMHISNFLFMTLKKDFEFSHMQILSPSNAVIKNNTDQYLQAHDILIPELVPVNGWIWEEKVLADDRYTAFRKKHDIVKPLACRGDGITCSRSIFAEFTTDLLYFYAINELEFFEPVYPMEETILPSYLERFRSYGGFRIGLTKAKTYEHDEGPVTVERLEQLVAQGDTIYVKRVEEDLQDPVRQAIRRRFTYGPACR